MAMTATDARHTRLIPQDGFAIFRGHLEKGARVLMNSGDCWRLRAVGGGWEIIDQFGQRVVRTDNPLRIEQVIAQDEGAGREWRRVAALEHVWKTTHPDYKLTRATGERCVMVLRDGGSCLVPLVELDEFEIVERTP